jgi:tetratricopeptide (TPR) repeat protein
LAVVATALYGLGGIGKTRAAVEYAWAFQEKYTALLFVIADTPEALPRNLAALTRERYLNLPEQAEKEEGARLRAVLDWLGANRGWLLILDNIDTPQPLAESEQLIGQLAGGHVVITSRLANFPADVDPLEVDVLDVGDAADFLVERTARQRRPAADDKIMARELAVDLGGLALALEHAGAYIIRHLASFRRYRELWQGSRDKVISWSDPAVTHYSRAIAATWQTSVEQLADPARRLLERLAWLAPEPVPEFLLDVPIPEDEGEDLYEALADLAAYSLATRDPEEPRFLVHGLVQDVTRRSLDAAASRRRIAEALGWVSAAFDGDPADVRTWSRLDPLAPHAQTVTERAEGEGITEPTARLMNRLGRLFDTKAMYAQAEPLMRRALEIAEANFGSEHPRVAVHLNSLAGLLQDTNRLAEAEKLYHRVLTVVEASLGSDHPDMATPLNNLAELLRLTNRPREAELLLRRALAIDEAVLGPDHPQVALLLNNLAKSLQATGRPGEAEPLFLRALAINEANLGPNHPNVARDLSNLAHLLQTTNRLNEAEPLMRRALAIDEASFGPSHSNVARDLQTFAVLLHATNRLARAEPLMRRARAIDEASLGPDHPNVAIHLNNLAGLLQDTNRLDGGGGPDAPRIGHLCRLRAENRTPAPALRSGFPPLHPPTTGHGQERGRDKGDHRRPHAGERRLKLSMPVRVPSPPFRRPRESGDPGKVVKSAAVDARLRGHDDEVGGWRPSRPY